MICSVIQDELQKLLGLRYSLALQNLNGAEIRLAEGLKINEILEQRFDLNLAEVSIGSAGAAAASSEASELTPFPSLPVLIDFIVGTVLVSLKLPFITCYKLPKARIS